MSHHLWKVSPWLSALVLCLAACDGSSSDDPIPSCDEEVCKAEGKICDYIRNTCVECLEDLDCSGKTEAPRCETATNTCVQCTDALHCASGQACVNNACVTPVECGEDNPCPSEGICSADGMCLTEQEVDCADLDASEIPANASQKEGKVEITWTAEDGWTSAAKCGWLCNPDFVENEAGSGCERQAITACEDDGDCTDQGCVEGQCASEKQVACDPDTDPTQPTDAVAKDGEVTVQWDVDAAKWAEAAKCEWVCPSDKPVLDEASNACVAESTAPICGDGKIEGSEACDTGANLDPVTAVFPESATCTSEINDGKAYAGALTCTSDCSAIETTGCTEVIDPPVSCTPGNCRTAMSGATAVTEICSETGDAWEEKNCAEGTECVIAEGADEGTCIATSTESARAFFSEYIEGSSNNKAIEVYNAGDTSVTCQIQLFVNGGVSAQATSPEFSIAAKDVYSFCHTSADESLRTNCEATNGVANFNGDDALELICGGQRVDVFGTIGEDPGSAWTANEGAISTVNKTLRRKCSVTAGITSNAASFPSLAIEWDVYAQDTFDGIGKHCSDIVTTCQAVGCTDNAYCSEIGANPQTCSAKCDDANGCVECLDSADCASELCNADGTCAATNSKQVDCIQASDVPENATANAVTMVTIQFTDGAWEAAPSCGWECNSGYEVNAVGDACIAEGTCGNHQLDVGEACDGTLFANDVASSCPTWFTGSKGCSSECTIIDDCVAPTLTCRTSPAAGTLGIGDTVTAAIHIKAVDGNSGILTGEGSGTANSPISAMKLYYRAVNTADWLEASDSGTSQYKEFNSEDADSIAYAYDLTEDAALADGQYEAIWGFTFNGVEYFCPAGTAQVAAAQDRDPPDGGGVTYALLTVDGEFCDSDADCLTGKETCDANTNDCVAIPPVCEAGCGMGENEGKLCVVDDMNPNGIWTDCEYGCETNACKAAPIEESCVNQDEYYCLEKTNDLVYCNAATGACVECLEDSHCNSSGSTSNECNLATQACQPKCGNGRLDEDEMCEASVDSSEWMYRSCEEAVTGTVGELSCTAACEIDDSACIPPTTAVTWCRLQWPEAITLNAENPSSTPIYGRFLIPAETTITPKLIYGTDAADIANWAEVDATRNESCDGCGNNTEYSANISATIYDALSAGNYKYTYKFSEDGANWFYCIYADGEEAAPKTAAEMINETRVGTLTVEKSADAPRVHTQTFDFVTSASNNYNITESTTDENGVTWSYTGRPNLVNSGTDYSIDGKGVIIRNDGNKISVSGFSGISKISFQYNWWGIRTDVIITTKIDETDSAEPLETIESNITGTEGKQVVELTLSSSSSATYLEITPKIQGNRIIIDNISITE